MPGVACFTISNNSLFDVIVNPPGGVPFLLDPTAVSAPQNGTGQYNIQPLGGAALFQVNLKGGRLNINPQASDASAFIVTIQLGDRYGPLLVLSIVCLSDLLYVSSNVSSG
jgi:hypothetical protein